MPSLSADAIRALRGLYELYLYLVFCVFHTGPQVMSSRMPSERFLSASRVPPDPPLLIGCCSSSSSVCFSRHPAAGDARL